MPSETPSSRPVDAYKQIIDDLVSDTPSLGARLILEHGIYSKAPDAEKLNELVGSLTPEQCKVLARMLTEERSSAMHDVLAAITWWIDCRGLGLTYDGKPMPVQLSGMGMHGDYAGRLDDWEWPDGDATA